MNLSTVDLFASAIRLFEDESVRAEDRRMSGNLEGWTMATFHVESNEDVHADHWEMHPEAEEAVCVLTGGVRIYLRQEGSEDQEQMAALTAGNAFIVPRGRWHRLELDGPSDLMSITLRRGSRLEKRDVEAAQNSRA